MIIYIKTVLFFIALCQPKIMSANNGDQKEIKTHELQNVKTFSGPMGMGLIKSYELNDKKLCIYNTINGQITMNLDDVIKDCPKNIKGN